MLYAEYVCFCFHTVPSSPTVVSVLPLYRVDGSIQYVDVGFTGVVSFKKLMNTFLVLIFTVIISHILRYYNITVVVMRAAEKMCLYTFSTWTNGLNKDVNNIKIYTCGCMYIQ